MADAMLSPEEIYSLLSQHNGDLNARDDYGLSVILAAALYDQDDETTSPNLPLLNFLLEREDIPRLDALELAGAVILFYEENHEMFPLAFQLWRRALALRLLNVDYCRPIHKTPLKSKSGQLSEWSTLADLERIEQDPDERLIQSLLVRLRISSNICWAAVDDIFFFPMFEEYRYPPIEPGATWSYKILDLCWTTLDTLLGSQRPHEKHLVGAVKKTEVLVVELFQDLPKGHANFNSTNFETFVELLLMSDLPFFTSNPNLNPSNLYNLCEMFEVLSNHPQLITEEIRLSLVQLVSRDGRTPKGFNLFHTACHLIQPRCLPLILFLVKLGADPNARVVNNRGYGVLHMLAIKPESEARDAAARLLLENGAHLDMADNFGRTAADYWLEKNNQERHRLPDWLQEGVPKLKGLCSRVMRRHRVPYKDEAILPAVLIPFVALH